MLRKFTNKKSPLGSYDISPYFLLKICKTIISFNNLNNYLDFHTLLLTAITIFYLIILTKKINVFIFLTCVRDINFVLRTLSRLEITLYSATHWGG